MTAARRIGVRQLVHQYERGAAAEDGIDVHLGQRAAEILELTPWNDFEWLDQCFGLGPAVGFDHTDDDKIGRASGRESVCQYVLISVVAVALKKNNNAREDSTIQ